MKNFTILQMFRKKKFELKLQTKESIEKKNT
jgi:hypothetical protein